MEHEKTKLNNNWPP